MNKGFGPLLPFFNCQRWDYHTITARSQDILDEVKKSLDKMGILCENGPMQIELFTKAKKNFAISLL